MKSPGQQWQVVSSELSHGGDNALLNHAFFLEKLGFHCELSCQVLTGHDLDLHLRSDMTTTHSAAAMEPLLIWHPHIPVLPISAVAASSPSSLANPPQARKNEYPEQCLLFLSTPGSCAVQIASTKWLLEISPSSLLPTLPAASFGDSPGFPQSIHKEFSVLFHTSFRAFMLRSFPPAIASE